MGDRNVSSPGKKKGNRKVPPSSSLKLPIPADRRGTPCGCPAGSHRPPAESPLHPSPGPVVPKQWPADGGTVRGRATTRVAPTSRSTTATRWAPLMDNPRPVSRRIMPEAGWWGTSEKTCPPGGGTFLPPSSPRLPSLGPGGAGVARIGGGTFSPPVRVGVGKPPLLLFLAGFRRTGAGGGAPTPCFTLASNPQKVHAGIGRPAEMTSSR